ncbi:MAG: SUMF1/EgtB/PvdO family nonheme iron enzyme, partial [Myxococcales bacterium]|nr:SUMF1/EgtB/PvdO family nonheme iron enzyme [Myxococcales bacterium]
LDRNPDGHTLDYSLAREGSPRQVRRALQADAPGRGPQALARWLLRTPALDEAGAAHAVWSEARALAGAGGVVDIRLRCRGGHLADRPWERMAHPETGVPLALDPAHSFARWTPGRAVGARPLPLRRAVGVLADAMREAPIPSDFGRDALTGAIPETTWRSPGTVSAWRAALAAEPDVLLLVSHGGPLAPELGDAADAPWAVYLEGDGSLRRYALDALVEDLSLSRRPPALVCLTACGSADQPGSGFTDLGARLVAAGAEAAVVMTGRAPQPTVQAFLSVFLDGAARHGDLAAAAQAARRHLRDAEVAGGWIPVLHVADPSARIGIPEPRPPARPPVEVERVALEVAAPNEPGQRDRRAGRRRAWGLGLLSAGVLAAGIGLVRPEVSRPQDAAAPAYAVDAGEPLLESVVATAHRPALRPVPLAGGLMAAATETTRAQYRSVVGDIPATAGCAQPNCPVVDVTWVQALIYANRLSTLEERAPCYRIDPAGALPVAGCDGYRLPNEAEAQALAWAGRAAAPDSATRMREAWLAAPTARAAGQGAANPWGLYDVQGNVGEWAWAAHGVERPVTGGSWRTPAEQAGQTRRLQPDDHADDVGFRVVRSRLGAASDHRAPTGSARSPFSQRRTPWPPWASSQAPSSAAVIQPSPLASAAPLNPSASAAPARPAVRPDPSQRVSSSTMAWAAGMRSIQPAGASAGSGPSKPSMRATRSRPRQPSAT